MSLKILLILILEISPFNTAIGWGTNNLLSKGNKVFPLCEAELQHMGTPCARNDCRRHECAAGTAGAAPAWREVPSFWWRSALSAGILEPHPASAASSHGLIPGSTASQLDLLCKKTPVCFPRPRVQVKLQLSSLVILNVSYCFYKNSHFKLVWKK